MGRIKVQIPLVILALWVILALFADFIASSNPILIRDERGLSFVGPYSDFSKKSQQDYETILMPLVPFLPTELDLSNKRFSSPGSTLTEKEISRVHYLGTDRVGRDILSGLIHGARFSLFIVLASVFIIGVFGTLIGVIMGLFGDKGLVLSRFSIILISIGLFLGLFWIQSLGLIKAGLGLGIMILTFLILSRLVSRSFPQKLGRNVSIPLDYILSRLLEIFETIPKLFLLLVLISLWDPSTERLILALALTGWVTLTKMIRGKTLSITNSQLFDSLKALGSPWHWSLRHHVFPFILPDLLAYLAYLAGNIILIESALSFLGLGVSPDVVSWGSMLSLSIYKPDFWWLAVLPGLFIFAIVFSLVRVGDLLYSRLNPEQTNWRYYDLV